MLTEFLVGTPPRKLFLPFNVLLELCNVAGELQDQYTVKESRDPHLYPGTFQREPGQLKEMQFITVMWEELSKWKILADDPNKAGVSIAELIAAGFLLEEPRLCLDKVTRDGILADGQQQG